MSKAKDDLLKQINKVVARKKVIAKQLTREKTIASWVSEFFTEYEKMKKVDLNSSYSHWLTEPLSAQLRKLDSKCYVVFKEPTSGDPIIEIVWSPNYIQENNCEEVLVFDASSAHFQSAVEQLT